jgi:hypothetical protein
MSITYICEYTTYLIDITTDSITISDGINKYHYTKNDGPVYSDILQLYLKTDEAHI